MYAEARNFSSSGRNSGARREERRHFSITAQGGIAFIEAKIVTYGARFVERGRADIDLRNAINEGIVPGPRMVIATEGMREIDCGPRYFHLVDSPHAQTIVDHFVNFLCSRIFRRRAGRRGAHSVEPLARARDPLAALLGCQLFGRAVPSNRNDYY